MACIEAEGRHLVVSMAHQVHQHGEGGLPFNTDWEQACLVGSLPARLVHCLMRLTAHVGPNMSASSSLDQCPFTPPEQGYMPAGQLSAPVLVGVASTNCKVAQS